MKRLGGLLLLAAIACGRPSSGAAEIGPAASASSATAIASAAPSSRAGPAAGATGVAWHGTYKTAVGKIEVPTDWSKTHWSSSDVATGVGDGTVDLTVDAATGQVTGTLDGAVGGAVIVGVAQGGRITASVRRKDPSDRGLTGTLVCTVSGQSASGTLSLASGDGNNVRTGTFTLAPAGH